MNDTFFTILCVSESKPLYLLMMPLNCLGTPRTLCSLDSPIACSMMAGYISSTSEVYFRVGMCWDARKNAVVT